MRDDHRMGFGKRRIPITLLQFITKDVEERRVGKITDHRHILLFILGVAANTHEQGRRRLDDRIVLSKHVRQWIRTGGIRMPVIRPVAKDAIDTILFDVELIMAFLIGHHQNDQHAYR
jgi:hypothetical protein